MRYSVTMTIDETVGSNVHELLWRRKMRQGVLLEAMGVQRSTLAKKLRGEIAWSAQDIDTAARVLGVDPGRLFVVAGAGFEPATSGTRAGGVVIPLRRAS